MTLMNAPTAQRPARARYPEIDLPMKGIRCRIVRGSLTKLVTTDLRKQPIEERRHHWFTAYAVPKNTPGIVDVINALFGHAWASYSAVAGAKPTLDQISLGFSATQFAWGVTDADLDAKWAAREGCAGCYVFKTRRNVALGPVPCFVAGQHGPGSYTTIDPAGIGLGDYVEVSLVTSINGEVGGTAGMFVQPAGLLWLETGQRIVAGGRSAQEMFGTTARPAAAPPQPAGGVQPAHGHPMHAPAAPQLQPGMAGPPPGLHAAPPPPPAAPAPTVEPAEAVAARHGVPHHAGYRFNPTAWAYEPDVNPTPAPAPAHQPAITSPQMNVGTYGASAGHAAPGGQYNPNAAAAPAAPASAPQHQVAPSAGVGGQTMTAYPGNPYGPGNPPPGVVPNHGFVGGHTAAPAGGPPRVG